jgi:cytoskeletal protein CcmA (bactofilin family)
MFGGKDNNVKPKGPSQSPVNPNAINSLVQGAVVEGSVKSESDIRVDGTIKGKLHCDTKVVIGPTGFVDGEIRCANAVIEGKFEGTIIVSELLNVRESAVVNGNVTTGKLIVQAGAVFNVTCEMGGSSGSNTSPKASSSSSAKPEERGAKAPNN